MSAPFTVGLIRASLPSYFPEQHDVWRRAEASLRSLCEQEQAELFVASTIPMDAREAQLALDACLSAGADFILVLHGGFTMGDVARTIAAAPVRAGFWSTPEPVRTGDIQLNNFVSLNMSLSIARQVRDLKTHPVQWYHGAPESAALQRRLGNTLRALRALNELVGTRIGVVGGLAMTFYNMEVSSNELRRRLGVDVSHIDMHELTERMSALEATRVHQEVELMSSAVEATDVSDEQMALTARAALALRDIATDGQLDALAVSDWPALQASPGMHPGAAFTWLEERDALPVASEGDVLGAVTQLLARSLTGKVGYLLDMTEPDLDSGQLLMWHGGGGPMYLADDQGTRWINHPMIGRGTEAGPIHGAIADLVFREGEVSVFRVAREGGALFQMTANVVARDPSGFTGCRGWLEAFRMGDVELSLEDTVATVMAHGLEHHFVLIPGNLADVLSELASWSNMQILDVRRMKPYLDANDFS